MGNRTAYGAAVADLRIADLACHVRQQRHVVAQRVADLEIPVTGQRPDDHPIPVLADIGQLGEPADVHQLGRGGEPQLHQREQRVTACQQLRILSPGGQADRPPPGG